MHGHFFNLKLLMNVVGSNSFLEAPTPPPRPHVQSVNQMERNAKHSVNQAELSRLSGEPGSPQSAFNVRVGD